jgi:hypothetical protein
MRKLPFVPMAMLVVACGYPSVRPESASVAATAARASQFDSATIERLCAHPDRVRAKLADCVLKDQSPPRTFTPAKPPQH